MTRGHMGRRMKKAGLLIVLSHVALPASQSVECPSENCGRSEIRGKPLCFGSFYRFTGLSLLPGIACDPPMPSEQGFCREILHTNCAPRISNNF